MTCQLYRFDEGDSARRFGSKAHRLSIMFREKFPVPFGLIVPPEALEWFISSHPDLQQSIRKFFTQDGDQEVIGALRSLIERCDLPQELTSLLSDAHKEITEKGFVTMAVRSSGTLEDGQSTSFAGQFDTFLDIETVEQLALSVKKCWASMYNDRVLAYCLHNRIPPEQMTMAVVIQGQIDADFSGVVFTANPMTGNDKEMVIESVTGMGEQMVQGSVDPDRFYYQWFEDEVRIDKIGNLNLDENGAVDPIPDQYGHGLADEQVRTLGQACLEIQRHFGEPLDIEWAFAEGEFHILQARPLTAIHFDTPYEWTNADLKDGGISSSVTTPMMYSLYEHIFEMTMPGYFRSIRVLQGKPVSKWFTSWFGYCYWNLTGVKESLKMLPGFQERTFDEGLGIEPAYDGPGYTSGNTPRNLIRGVRALLATKKSIRNRPAECKSAVRLAREIFEQHQQINLNECSLPELLSYLTRLIHEHYTFIEGAYFYTIYDNSNAASFFQDHLRKYNRKAKIPIHYLNLIAGLSNLSHLRPVFDLWDISRTIKHNPEASEFYLNCDANAIAAAIQNGEPFPVSDQLQNYISKYKHHSYKELDITVPNWDEDASQVAELLLQFIRQGDEDNPRAAAHMQQQAFHVTKEQLHSKKLLKELAHHRHLLWWREELRDNSSKMYNILRKTLMQIGDKLFASKVLNHPEDLFMLTFQELFALDPNRAETGILRRVEKNRLFRDCFRHFAKPNEILHGRKFIIKSIITPDSPALNGIAGSAGTARGKARVITSVYDAVLLEKGEILVTSFTDPAWTSYFMVIAALVTETGGVLSHGAVVSREYGIPAVLGLKSATLLIRTGDLIEVDGYNGKVNIIS